MYIDAMYLRRLYLEAIFFIPLSSVSLAVIVYGNTAIAYQAMSFNVTIVCGFCLWDSVFRCSRGRNRTWQDLINVPTKGCQHELR